ncbi:unnamed protein product [Phaedon cochleariae]|uniref:Double jelly roll-like domain-containing protein n=1 Tax=Phaedon cochleariae TaxID=80249 RepID=A0A9P0DZ45_PHACE|nr:unnamed protein product [Phaedon cochleariae]
MDNQINENENEEGEQTVCGEIRERVEQMVIVSKDIKKFVLDDSNKISKVASSYILDKVAVMEEIIGKLIAERAEARGRAEECRALIKLMAAMPSVSSTPVSQASTSSKVVQPAKQKVEVKTFAVAVKSDKDVTDAELLEDLYNKNGMSRVTVEDFNKWVKVESRKKMRHELDNVILNLNDEIAEYWIGKEYVYVGWKSCKVKEVDIVKRCFKCCSVHLRADQCKERGLHEHTYKPYGSPSFKNSDEIRIAVNFQDLILDIAESYIYIEGKFIPNDLAKTCHLSNNALAFLFDEIRYEMGGEQVCLIRKPGITTTMKSMISYGETSTKFLDTVGWGLDENKQVILDTPSHTFSGKLPLKFLMGFAEDYNKGILNIKQELILIIARSFKNSYMGEVDANVTINKIEWKIRHVMPSDRQKLKLLNRLNKSSTAKIKLAYRMWDLYELPAIRETASDIWAIKTTSSLERPRYIIIGFQSSDNTDDRSKDATKFIHAGVNNIRLYLNSEVYPYERWNLDFDRKLDAVAYYAYENFQRSYYGKDICEPMMSIEEFRKNPLFIIDCYHQPDAMKTSTVDIKLEFETRETKFPPNTKLIESLMVGHQIAGLPEDRFRRLALEFHSPWLVGPRR